MAKITEAELEQARLRASQEDASRIIEALVRDGIIEVERVDPEDPEAVLTASANSPVVLTLDAPRRGRRGKKDDD